MSDEMKPGQIGWHDLTVPDAGALRDFYAEVVGWDSDEFDMGGYSDYVMTTPDLEAPVGGICHARGVNANVPPQWLIYIVVEDLESSIAKAVDGGGTLIDGPRSAGEGQMAIIRDPAGAAFGLYLAP
jgi:uncharacterized protein